MSRVAHLGTLAGSHQASSPPSGGEAHRYWRVFVTATENGFTRVRLSEIEFWDRRYARRAVGTYFESGATFNPGFAYDGIQQRSATASTYWISNTGTVWLGIDAGSPIDLAAVVLWKAGSSSLSNGDGDHIGSFDVQFSDDGSNWTTLWSVADASMASIDTPRIFENPYYSGDLAPDLDPSIVPLHWLKLDGAVYSDAGMMPAGDNDGIALAANYGSAGSAFTQASSGIRPIFKTGGLAGKPFLRCAYSSAQRFDDIAITQPSGTTSLSPYCVFAVTNNVDLTNSPALLGSAASNGGKIGVYFRPDVDEQIHIGRAQFRFGNLANPQLMVLSRFSRTQFHAGVNGFLTYIFDAFNETSNAISSANLLWNDGLSTDGFFDGDLYELGYIDAAVSSLEILRVSEYLNGKYGGIY